MGRPRKTRYGKKKKKKMYSIKIDGMRYFYKTRKKAQREAREYMGYGKKKPLKIYKIVRRPSWGTREGTEYYE